MNLNHRRFQVGRQIVATPGALEVLEASRESPVVFLRRHVDLDQGELCLEDHRLNLQAVRDGSRILSAFKTRLGDPIWVITDAVDDSGSRYATTLLLPTEY
jgi:hypothetical protein